MKLENKNNFDKKTVDDFGNEWSSFDQTNNLEELKKIYSNYFKIFPYDKINQKHIGFDAGCGTGRWAYFTADNVKKIYCIEPSIKAINVAKQNLKFKNNCLFFNQTINEFFDDTKQYFDFGYSLGVIHHIPDTLSALQSMTSRLKPNAPLLLYIYYNFENRSFMYIFIWKISNIVRFFISKLPFYIKKKITDLIALLIYYPFAKLNLFLDLLNIKKFNFPLSYYKKKSFYVMRNDSLDRFGTRLEKRFSKRQIEKYMREASLKDIIFYDQEPFWVVVGYKK